MGRVKFNLGKKKKMEKGIQDSGEKEKGFSSRLQTYTHTTSFGGSI